MENSIEILKEKLLNSRMRNEKAEVVLLNLLRLKNESLNSFKVPYDEVVITIEAAILILQE